MQNYGVRPMFERIRCAGDTFLHWYVFITDEGLEVWVNTMLYVLRGYAEC